MFECVSLFEGKRTKERRKKMEKYKARMKCKMLEALRLTKSLCRFREMIHNRHYSVGCACDFEDKVPTGCIFVKWAWICCPV